MGKIYDDGKLFSGVSYSVDEIEFTYTSWSDDIGSSITKVAKGVPSAFNYAQDALWEKAGPLLKVEEDKIKYCGYEGEIWGLKVDD